MRNRIGRALIAGALMAGVLGACGDDDDEMGSATETEKPGSSDNTLEIEMVDYAYAVSGKLRPGLATITSRNTGKEFHMAAIGKLKPGKKAADLRKALESQDGPEGGGGTEGGGGAEGGGGTEGGGGGGGTEGGGSGGGEQGTAAIQLASLSQQGGEGGGGGQGGDPLAEFVEKELGTPGHLLQPGQSQSLTVDVLEEGSYVLLCFLPTEGEGVPHLAKGMVSGFEVGKGESRAKAPEADATITLGDEVEPAGVPTDLAAGEHTFKVTASGSKGKDFAIANLKEGEPFEAFDKFFESEFEKEGGPSKGAAQKAPGTIYASTLEIEPGQSIWVTVNIPSGETYFLNTTNSENQEEDSVDRFVKVNVT